LRSPKESKKEEVGIKKFTEVMSDTRRVTSENIVAVLVTSTETNEQALAAASASTTLRASGHRKRLVFWDHPFVIKEG